MSGIVSLIPKIKTDRLGNALNKVQNRKTDFKGNQKNSISDLWICTKSYKVGNISQLTKFVNEGKQKKHGIIVNPVSTQVICAKKKLGGEVSIRELGKESSLNQKERKKVETFLD